MTRPITCRVKLLLSVFSLLVFCSVLELTFRLVGTRQDVQDSRDLPFWVLANIQSQFLVPDPVRFWKLPAGSAKHHVNALGLLGDEVQLVKPHDGYRIQCLGDSITFGFGVAYQQAYPYALEQLLNRTRTPLVFEVWNAGVPGYSSLQGLRYFQQELAQCHPDVVTVCFGRNDRRFLNQEGGYLPDSQVQVTAQWISRLKRLLSFSQFYQFFRGQILQARFKQNLAKEQTANQGQCRIEPDEFAAIITELLGSIRRHGAVPIILTAPVRFSSIGTYNYLLRELAAANSVPLVDVEARFSDLNVEQFLLDDCHPNQLGHQLIAENLYRLVMAQLADRHHLAVEQIALPPRTEFITQSL